MTDVHSVIVSGKQMGKTYTMMTEIHDLIVRGRHGDVLVVFPTSNYLHWWVREWQNRFPWVPMVDYTIGNNVLKVRGRQYGKIYVEDVDAYPNGIYEDKFQDLNMCLVGDDAEIVFSCSLLPVNQKSHNATVTVKRVYGKLYDKLFDSKKLQQQLEDQMMVAQMVAYIHD